MNEIIDRGIIRINYLYIDKYLFPLGWTYPNTKTPYSLFRLITKGKGKFIIDSEEILIEENSFIYIPEGCMLSCEAITNWFEFISIRFTTSIKLDDKNIPSYELDKLEFLDKIDKGVADCFYKMISLKDNKNVGSIYAIRGYLELIFAYLINEKSKDSSIKKFNSKSQDTEKNYNDRFKDLNIKEKNDYVMDIRIQKVIEYLIAHQYERIEINTLNEMTNLSPSSFRRLFKYNTGKSPGEFIYEIKMMAAAKRLLSTEDRISSIAYDIGFDCPNYFTRQFKKRFGVSPQVYRHNSRI